MTSHLIIKSRMFDPIYELLTFRLKIIHQNKYSITFLKKDICIQNSNIYFTYVKKHWRSTAHFHNASADSGVGHLKPSVCRRFKIIEIVQNNRKIGKTINCQFISEVNNYFWKLKILNLWIFPSIIFSANPVVRTMKTPWYEFLT